MTVEDIKRYLLIMLGSEKAFSFFIYCRGRNQEQAVQNLCPAAKQLEKRWLYEKESDYGIGGRYGFFRDTDRLWRD